MKLSNEIKNKFDDIDGKIDFVIELCQALQQENSELILKIKDLETRLDKKNVMEEEFSEQEALIKSKIDGLLNKLNYFSSEIPGNYQSSL
jgi:cell division septum initiation protein DivIVA